MAGSVYLNGEFMPLEAAKVSVMDRGFLFADGVYEVIPIYGGKLFHAEGHMARLQRSLDGIDMAAYKVDRDEWSAIFARLIEENGTPDVDYAIYLQITRGAYEKRTHTFPDTFNPTVFAQCTPIAAPPSEVIAQGFGALTHENIRWMNCHIKSIALLPNILLSQAAKAKGAIETIWLQDGMALEGASSNLLIVKDGVIMTAPLSLKILGGITRDAILVLAKAHNVPHEETEISEAALRGADEVWITSSTRAIYPIVRLDDQPVGDGHVGPVWQQMIAYYWASAGK